MLNRPIVVMGTVPRYGGALSSLISSVSGGWLSVGYTVLVLIYVIVVYFVAAWASERRSIRADTCY